MMPLILEQAKKLKATVHAKINLIEIETKAVQDIWNTKMKHPKWCDSNLSYQDLQKQLINWRKASLNRRSIVLEFENEELRVFPHSNKNIDNDVYDIFARGLDTARAVTEILKHTPPPFELMAGLRMDKGDRDLVNLTRALNTFQNNMVIHKKTAEHDAKKGMDNAIKELKRFNGALATLLKDRVSIKQHEATSAINFVRDFLWKQDICTPCCVVEDIDGLRMLRYAKPMTFAAVTIQRGDSEEPIDYWSDKADGTPQAWKTTLFQAIGSTKNPWFHEFMQHNLNSMRMLSSTPMSRFTPNPANAFDCSTIMIQHDEVTHVSHHIQTAITEPLAVDGAQNRQEITDWNHLQLISTQRLESELNTFMEHWGGLIDEGPIPLIMLHQTLVGDEVTLSPDQLKAKQSSVINSKLKANAAVRELIQNSKFIRDNQGQVTCLPANDFTHHYPQGLPEGYREVTIHLLETNNGINMWFNRTRVRNNDFQDARELITHSVYFFSKILERSPNENLRCIMNFLNSSDHSMLTPYKFRRKEVKDAIRDLTEKLRNDHGPFQDLAKNIRENIALSVLAAVELKCTVHETWLGSARRKIVNFASDYLPLPVNQLVRFIMFSIGFILKIISMPFNMTYRIKHWHDRREIYKSSYEGILAESLGTLQGGCMSAVDRAGEMAEQRACLKKQFACEGSILSYNDSAREKSRVYARHGKTKAKHDFVEMATGTPGTSDTETRGFWNNKGVLSMVAESPEEKNLAKTLSHLRTGIYAKEYNVEDYVHSPEVNGVKSKAKTPPQPPSSDVIHRHLFDPFDPEQNFSKNEFKTEDVTPPACELT